MSRHEIELAFRGKDEGAGSTVERLAQRLRLMKQEAAASGEGALKRTLSSGEGLVAAAAQSLGVGVEALAIGQIAEMAEKASEKVLTLRESMGDLKMGAADIAGEFARSIPVLGQMISFWDNLFELVSDTAREAEKFGEASEAQAQGRERQRATTQSQLDEIYAARLPQKLADIAASGDSDEQIALKQAQAKQDAMMAQIDEQIRLQPDTGMQHQLREHENAEIARTDREQQKMVQDFRREAAKAAFHGSQDTADMEAQARETELRENGKAGEAELEQIRRDGERKNAELRQQKEEADKHLGPIGQKTRDKQFTEAVNANEALTQSRENAAKKDAAIQESDKKYELDRALATQRNIDVQEKGQLSLAQKREAMKANVELDSDARIHALQKIIDDKQSSADQKSEAQTAMITETLNRRKKLKAIEESPFFENRRGVGVTAGLNDRFHDIAGAFAGGAEPALLAAEGTQKNTQKTAVTLESIDKGIAAMLAAFQKGLVGRSLGAT